jgi:hypothetical protein
MYRIWYLAVSTYSKRHLAFPSEKLPAMAGIASRIQAITHDTCLAGHWHRELERSLFWTCLTGYTSSRVKPYRAPSWSWASIDGPLLWDFADLSFGKDKPAPIDILEVSTEVEGQNAFGTVCAANLVLSAYIIRARWNADLGGWSMTGTFEEYEDKNYGGLGIFSADESSAHLVGYWYYDDEVNRLSSKPPLSLSTFKEDIHADSTSTAAKNNVGNGGKSMKLPSRERGTSVPEKRTFVKGPSRKAMFINDASAGRGGLSEILVLVEILVLAETERHIGEYRRVGVGRLKSWNKGVESVEVITIV